MVVSVTTEDALMVKGVVSAVSQETNYAQSWLPKQ
jgi:hypothetical protein